MLHPAAVLNVQHGKPCSTERDTGASDIEDPRLALLGFGKNKPCLFRALQSWRRGHLQTQ